jgi:hypothetical protein
MRKPEPYSARFSAVRRCGDLSSRQPRRLTIPESPSAKPPLEPRPKRERAPPAITKNFMPPSSFRTFLAFKHCQNLGFRLSDGSRAVGTAQETRLAHRNKIPPHTFSFRLKFWRRRGWDEEFCCGYWACRSQSSFCCGCSSAADRRTGCVPCNRLRRYAAEPDFLLGLSDKAPRFFDDLPL